MAKVKKAMDPVKVTLLHKRVQLQVRIELVGGSNAMERELTAVEAEITAFDRIHPPSSTL